MNWEQLTNWNILEQAQYKDVSMLRLNVYFASLQAEKLIYHAQNRNHFSSFLLSTDEIKEDLIFLHPPIMHIWV